MADGNEDQQAASANNPQQTARQQGQSNELGEDGARDRDNDGSFEGQSSGSHGSRELGPAAQPNGGNGGNSGSGTTLTQGAEFGGQSSSGQTQEMSGSRDRLSDGSVGQGTPSNAEGSSVGSGQASGSSSGCPGRPRLHWLRR